MNYNQRLPIRPDVLGGLLILALLGNLPSPAWAQDTPVLDWRLGDGAAPIGTNLAEIQLSDDYVYLDGDETRTLMELSQNPPSDREVATISPASNEENWFLVFEWDPIGYVADDEHEDLDAEEILSTLKEGNEVANEERLRRNWAPVNLVGWKEPPFYDETTQNLTWAMIGESEGRRTINRNVRLLGRKGVMSATLIANPEDYSRAVAETDALLEGFRFKPGNKYAEFVPGEDRVAEIGLAALITGGAVAAAAKSGLLARFWKLFAAGAVALLAAIRSMFGKLFGRSGRQERLTR